MVPTRIRVASASPYDVVVGRGLTGELPSLVSAAQRVAVIHPATMGERARVVERVLANAGLQPLLLEVPDGEASKDLSVAGHLWDALGAAGFTRTDAVVAVGGGATTDLAGFVAATWLRGVPVVHLPTTLLGMVDAAVGGKTGINTESGKNLVGAFHEPSGVLCDLDELATLPRADYISGLAEVVKVGLTHDPRILDLIDQDPAAATTPEGPHTEELIQRAIAVKARVVAEDLTEQGGREALNYGHTLAHAIEKVEGYTWRHGEAVSVGLVFAAELAHAAAGLDAEVVTRHRTTLSALGLPTRYDGDWAALLEVMRVDKKSRASTLRFIVLDAIGAPRVLEGPSDQALNAAWERVRLGPLAP